jgi:hypothetical protein
LKNKVFKKLIFKKIKITNIIKEMITKEYFRQYYHENPEYKLKNLERAKRRYIEKKDELRDGMREYNTIYRQKNQDKIIAYREMRKMLRILL